MAITDTAAAKPSYLEWGPILAGAIAAAALSFLLLTFGGPVGLSLTSPWPGTGAKLWVVALALAWWMVLVQIGSFAAGGYLAGRMRSRWMDSRSSEGAFRDSTHGFMVWAVGVFGAFLASVLLLLRRRSAFPVFVTSLAAFLISLLYTYVLTNGGAIMGQQMAITSAVIAGLLALFCWYSRSMTARGVLR